MAKESTTIRVRHETRDKINGYAKSHKISVMALLETLADILPAIGGKPAPASAPALEAAAVPAPAPAPDPEGKIIPAPVIGTADVILEAPVIGKVIQAL